VATKQEVIDLNKKYPNWTAVEIANELGCSPEYVGACKHRYGLKFASATRRSDNPNSVFALGREARRAGLTVEKIQQMGRSNG
jgi:hypothetical protein